MYITQTEERESKRNQNELEPTSTMKTVRKRMRKRDTFEGCVDMLRPVSPPSFLALLTSMTTTGCFVVFPLGKIKRDQSETGGRGAPGRRPEQPGGSVLDYFLSC